MTDTQLAAAPAKQAHPIVVMRDYLEARSAELKAALPPHIPETKFIRAVVTACQINPELLACDKRSMWNACLRACNDGLLPDGREGAIAPFKGVAQWLPMYGGLLKQFRNSGLFKWIGAGIVREGEEFEHYVDETGEHFKHRPGHDSIGKIISVYAAATTKDGAFFVAVLTPAEIDKRRKVSRASRSDAPWVVWPEEMMKKTAVKALAKMLPKSSDRDDLDEFLQRDDDEDLGIPDDTSSSIAPGLSNRSALDHFAGDLDEPAEGDGAATTTAAGDGQAATATEGGDNKGNDRAPAHAPDAEALATAYQRGIEARKNNLTARQMPGEYRDVTRLALSWRSGLDGNPMPTFKD